MERQIAIETLAQLKRYTYSAAKLLGVDLRPGGRNHSGPYKEGQPTGVICHYTASNAAKGPRRPYGRLPVMLRRLRPLSGQGVGCHVVVWDEPVSRLQPLKARYPLLQAVPAEVLFFGDELALWHAGSANRWSLGIEVRNCGELHRSSRGAFFWNRGKHRYRGRTPLEINGTYWEPFTYSQMLGTLWISRLFAAVHPIQPQRFLGHTQVSSTRIDPGPHFPLHELRSAVFSDPDQPLIEVPYLKEFERRYVDGDETAPYDDPMVSEESLHQGKYRADWDGDSDPLSVKIDSDRLFEDWIADPDLDPDPNLVIELKKALIRLGYDPGSSSDPKIGDQLKDTIRLFQGRWKKRVKRRGRKRWVQAVPITGKVDQEVLRLIERFDRQQWRLVS